MRWLIEDDNSYVECGSNCIWYDIISANYMLSGGLIILLHSTLGKILFPGKEYSITEMLSLLISILRSRMGKTSRFGMFASCPDPSQISSKFIAFYLAPGSATSLAFTFVFD